MIQVYSIIIFITGVLFIGFGLLAYLRNKKGISNKLFGLVALSFAIWIISWFGLLMFHKNPSIAIQMSKLLNFGALWIPIFYLHWVIATAGYFKNYKIVLFAGYLFTSLFALFGFSDFYISGTHTILTDFVWPTPGFLYKYFIIFGYSTMFGGGFIYLLRKINNARSYKRMQLVYMFIGSLFGFLGGATNFIFMYRIELLINHYILFGGALALMLTPVLFTYATVKYRFMNIRYFLSKSMLYFLLIAVITAVFTFTTFSISRYVTTTSRIGELIIVMTVSFAIVLVLDPLKRMLAKVTDHIFYKDKIDYQDISSQISLTIAREIDLEILIESLTKLIEETLKVKDVNILIKKNGSYESPVALEETPDFKSSSLFIKYLKDHEDSVVVDELYRKTADLPDGSKRSKNEQLLDELERKGVEFFTPVYLEGQLKAIIILSQKQSGDIYTGEDVAFFSGLAPQIAVAIEKSQLYESIGEFNLKLQDKINKATQELKETNLRLQDANLHLKQLDKAKSEFLSIASHQLRTPISAIKGYLSMLIEGDFGRVPAKQKKIISDIFESSSRLARLINIFLNVSRIESGKFKLDRSWVNLSQLVDGVVTELTGQAETKSLKLKVTNKSLPKLFIDSDKIREVILNLVDNAIKYTPKGVIYIKSFSEGDEVHFQISDNGVGIRSEDLKSLFRKFVRGTGIAQVNTTGSGLGLYIAQRVITEHGGKIWVDSEGLDKGSTFHFTIPVRQSDQ